MPRKRKFRADGWGWNIITVAVLIYFLLFFAYPLLSILISSVWNENTGAVDFSNFIMFFTEPFFLNTLWNSLAVTVCATLISTLGGVILAYILRSVSMRIKGIIDMALIASTISPPFLGAYSWIILLGRTGIITGWINSAFGADFDGIYGFGGILLVFSVKMIPLVYLYVSGALKNVDSSLLEAGESLGCKGIKRFFTIVFPLILPTILSSAILVFMRVLADFGTPQLIGEGYRTLPTLIYQTFLSDVTEDRPLAATIAVIVIVVTTVLFLIQRYFSNRKTIAMSALRPMEPKQAKGSKLVFSYVYVLIVTILAILPTVIILINSVLSSTGRVMTGDLTLQNYADAFKIIGQPLLNTVMYSLAALAIVIVVGVIVAYTSIRRKSKLTNALDVLAMFPYIIPGAVLGVAMLISFSGKPFMMAGSAFIIIMAFSIRRLPYTIRSSSAILRQIDLGVEEAAQSLGANKFKTFFKVTLPMMISGVLSGAIMSWLSIITELSSSVILYSYPTKTLSITIFLQVSEGQYGVASALSTILTVITIATLMLFFKLSGKKEISL